MYIFQANLVTNLANAAIVGACASSVGFMLRFSACPDEGAEAQPCWIPVGIWDQ
jgi:hypothetical protein